MEHSSIILSILICSLEERKKELGFIFEKLLHQRLSYASKIEVLIESDNREITIGEKRNILLSRAQGEYICFVDDDDDISNDYIESIMKALESKPDCVGIEGTIDYMGIKGIFKHSRQFQSWYTGPDAFYRTPNHLNPVKREIALRIGFPPQSFGEDQIYSNGIKRMLKTEVYINHPIYFYKKEKE